MKKVLAIMVAAMMLVSGTVFAADFDKVTVSQSQKLEEIARFLYALEYDATAFDMEPSDFDSLYIGAPIPAYEVLEDGLEPVEVENYPIFTHDDRLVLTARVLVKENGFVHITAGTDLVAELTPYYEDNAQIALVFDNTSGYVLSEGALETVYSGTQVSASGRVSAESINISALNLEETAMEKQVQLVALEQSESASYSQSSASSASTIPVQYSLDTPQYQQQKSRSCWAACVRTIGEYYSGLVKTESQVYSYFNLPYIDSQGANTYTAREALWGLYPNIIGFGGTIDDFNDSMPFYDYCGLIYAGYVMYGATFRDGVYDSDDPNEVIVGHAIVLRGYYNYQSTDNVGIINFMDPATGNNAATNVEFDEEYFYLNAYDEEYYIVCVMF